MLSRYFTKNIRNYYKNIYQFSIYHSFSTLPEHEIVGLPALSPTMAEGKIVKWHKQPGDSYESGESLCEIETDKATLDFEMTDDGFIIKHLLGEGEKANVGTPILVISEEEVDISAFENFEAPIESKDVEDTNEKETSSPSKDTKKKEEQPKEVKKEIKPKKQETKKSRPVSSPSTPPPSTPTSTSTQSIETSGWGKGIKDSPLYKILSQNQKNYLEKYGRTGHVTMKED